MRPRVQRAPGLPCALCLLGANVIANLGRMESRECGSVPHRHCEEHLRRSNPVFLCGLWIASRSLSSGAHSRDPLARNDGMDWLFEIQIRNTGSPHPEEARQRRLEGWRYARPWFETRRYAALLTMRHSHLKNLKKSPARWGKTGRGLGCPVATAASGQFFCA
jgi:hypothetical protein